MHGIVFVLGQKAFYSFLNNESLMFCCSYAFVDLVLHPTGIVVLVTGVFCKKKAWSRSLLYEHGSISSMHIQLLTQRDLISIDLPG